MKALSRTQYPEGSEENSAFSSAIGRDGDETNSLGWRRDYKRTKDTQLNLGPYFNIHKPLR